MNISPEKYDELLKKGISLDIVWIVEKARDGFNYEFVSLTKIENLKSTAIRKGLLTEEYKLTLEGKQLLEFLESEETTKLIKKKPSNNVFDMWWKEYPGTDSFEYKGRKFKGTRALRVKKEDCKAKIHKILNTGEYTIEELIGALKLEISQKMEDSYKKGVNKLTFMQNSLTYLNQMTYDPYVELYRKGEKIEEETKITSNETFI